MSAAREVKVLSGLVFIVCLFIFLTETLSSREYSHGQRLTFAGFYIGTKYVGGGYKKSGVLVHQFRELSGKVRSLRIRYKEVELIRGLGALSQNDFVEVDGLYASPWFLPKKIRVNGRSYLVNRTEAEMNRKQLAFAAPQPTSVFIVPMLLSFLLFAAAVWWERAGDDDGGSV